MLKELREQVLEANLELVRRGLVIYTFGNASGISRDDGLVAIKPSGVPYETMRPDDLVITDLEGRIVEGTLRPSSDLATHLVLYRVFPRIGGVVHTHSRYATSWAQARRPIPCLGTTHADYFRGPVPVTLAMSPQEIDAAYEANTGEVIARHFASGDAMDVPAVLVAGHGPFCWGPTAAEAAHNAVILEYVAEMALYSVTLADTAEELHPAHLDKHFLRKHGAAAYYGQKSGAD
ncbi:MAG TPA: L-ribulose-5-phosphate 4-epimerase [Bryobacteraceae bacterium]|nr:L-ribulose-5-phosphate 4-epimerase [Bryobacteraceae bacterium]